MFKRYKVLIIFNFHFYTKEISQSLVLLFVTIKFLIRLEKN